MMMHLISALIVKWKVIFFVVCLICTTDKNEDAFEIVEIFQLNSNYPGIEM